MLDEAQNTEIGTLLAKVAMHDRRAFDRLYEKTSPKLFGVALRMMKDRSEAEDLLQEAFVRIWQRAGTFRRGQGSAIGWLIALTRNLCIDRLRKQDLPVAPMEMAEDTPDQNPDPEQVVQQIEARAQIDACLEELETQRADAIRGAYLEGWSYQELAERFGKPLNTMRTWLRRSLLRLRACLEAKPL